MSDDPLDRIPSYDRVSIRAVVVFGDEDPSQALTDIGIFDPVSVPIVIGEESPDRTFGDGFTPNVTAVMEPDQEADEFDELDDFDEFGTGRAPGVQRNSPQRERFRPSPLSTKTLPSAFGAKPLAPVRPRGGNSGPDC